MPRPFSRPLCLDGVAIRSAQCFIRHACFPVHLHYLPSPPPRKVLMSFRSDADLFFLESFSFISGCDLVQVLLSSLHSLPPSLKFSFLSAPWIGRELFVGAPPALSPEFFLLFPFSKDSFSPPHNPSDGISPSFLRDLKFCALQSGGRCILLLLLSTGLPPSLSSLRFWKTPLVSIRRVMGRFQDCFSVDSGPSHRPIQPFCPPPPFLILLRAFFRPGRLRLFSPHVPPSSRPFPAARWEVFRLLASSSRAKTFRARFNSPRCSRPPPLFFF